MLLAIDPSSTCTGWALFDGSKCIDSGAIILPETGWWDEVLAERLLEIVQPLVVPDEPLTVLVEYTQNRSNTGQYFGPALLPWPVAVGVCIGALAGMVEFKRYPSNWLNGKPYAKCKLARHKKFRIACAQAYRPEVTQVDEATAVLFGQWYQTADPRLFDWKPPAPRKPRRRDGKLNLEFRTPSPGSTQTAQPVAATSVALPKRPGRRI